MASIFAFAFMLVKREVGWQPQKSRKKQAREFLDLIKKSKGNLKVYFAVGKGSDGSAVHVDKKKPKACVSSLKAKRVTTILAFGQLKFDDELTLLCLKQPNENAVRKSFFQFFKESEVSIPGASESRIVVLGPKDWDSAAEDEDAEAAVPPQSSSAGSPAPATEAAAAPAADQVAALTEAYKQLLPRMKEKVAARPELKDPMTQADRAFQDQLRSGAVDNARAALESRGRWYRGMSLRGSRQSLF